MTTVIGLNGSVSFDGRTVTLSREHARSDVVRGAGDQRIPIGKLTSVELKRAGFLTNGFIRFESADHTPATSHLGRSVAAAGDENAIMFSRRQRHEFEELHAEIKLAMGPGRA